MALVERETRLRPWQGRTLDRRVAAWKREVERATWTKPTEVKAVFGTADIVGDGRVVFDRCGNNYRFVVQFNDAAKAAPIRFADDYQEYDEIDARTV